MQCNAIQSTRIDLTCYAEGDRERLREVPLWLSRYHLLSLTIMNYGWLSSLSTATWHLRSHCILILDLTHRNIVNGSFPTLNHDHYRFVLAPPLKQIHPNAPWSPVLARPSFQDWLGGEVEAAVASRLPRDGESSSEATNQPTNRLSSLIIGENK